MIRQLLDASEALVTIEDEPLEERSGKISSSKKLIFEYFS